jgi:hypothetical protein
MLKKIRITSNWKSIPNDRFLVEIIKNIFITEKNYNKKYILTHENDFDYLVILNEHQPDILNSSIKPDKTILYYNEPSWHEYVTLNIKKNLTLAKYVCYHNCDLLKFQNGNYNFKKLDIKNHQNTFLNISGYLPHWVIDMKKNINLDYLIKNKFQKTKKCSFIVSSKTIKKESFAKATNSIYEQRLSLVKDILNSELDIDVYGKGLIKIFGEHPKLKGEIDSKLEGLKDYQFSIAIENTQENGYFTEKLSDCILTDTTPIYIGCPNIEDYFNNIHKINLENPIKQIEEILNKNLILDQTQNKKLFEFKYNLYSQIIDMIERYKI